MPESTDKDTPTPTPADKILVDSRDEDFTSLYASNVKFETTVWDLKMIFGEVDLAESRITQHTSMALSWPLAKIAAYYMLVNVVLRQGENGPISIPPNVAPPKPNPNEPNLNAQAKKAITYIAWIHEQIFGDNPYVPPEVAALDAENSENPSSPKIQP